MVLYQAAQESSCTRSGSDNREYTEFDNGFFASVSGSSTAHVLIDHKEDIR